MKKIVVVSLPEGNDGMGPPRGHLYVDADDVGSVEKALKGAGLGVMGSDAGVYAYPEELLSLEELIQKYPKV